jgi:hypothetical protein
MSQQPTATAKATTRWMVSLLPNSCFPHRSFGGTALIGQVTFLFNKFDTNYFVTDVTCLQFVVLMRLFTDEVFNTINTSEYSSMQFLM